MTWLRAIAVFSLALFSLQGVTAEDDPAEKNEIPAKVEEILRKGEKFEVLKLDPTQKSKGEFHGLKIVKTIMVKNGEERSNLVEELKKAVARSDQVSPREFEKPAHGVRVTHEGKTAELVISFAERKAIVYLDGKQLKTVRLTDDPAKLFDKIIDRD